VQTHLNGTQGLLFMLLELLQQFYGHIPHHIANVIQITFYQGDWIEGHFAGLGLLPQPYFLLLAITLNP